MKNILKKGYIRISDIVESNNNRPVKIGSNEYIKAVDRQIKKLNKEGKTKTALRTSKVFKKYLPELYSKNANIKTVRGLVRNRYRVSNDFEKLIIKKIFRLEMAKNNGKRSINFKYRGEPTFSNKFLSLRNDNLDEFVEYIISGYQYTVIPTFGSDAMNEFNLNLIRDFRIVDHVFSGDVDFKESNKNGSFFRYLNNTNINLERYQIMSKNSSSRLNSEHCLIYALHNAGIDRNLTNRIKSTFETGSYFPKKNLITVADIIKKTIILYTFDGIKPRTVKIGKYSDSVEIALYKDHYFILEDTIYTNYSSLNYEKVKDIQNFHNIYREVNGVFVKCKDKYKVNSLKLIRNLLETNNFIKDSPLIKKEDSFQKIKTSDECLDCIEEEVKEYEYKDRKEEKLNIFYADTETCTKDAHKPLLIGVVSHKNINIKNVKIFQNNEKDSVYYDFMDYIYKNSTKTENVIIYFHNLKYDYHVLLPYITHREAPCEKDNLIYSVSVLYKDRTFNFRDSYKLASFPLNKFQKTFNLDEEYNKKEAIAYDFYNMDNINSVDTDIKEYMSFLNEKDKNIFLDNLKNNKEFLYNQYDNTFDSNSYYRYYLKYDVLILALGIQKFESIINNITNNKLNLHNYLTISSLTYAYMGLNGSFDGVYQLSGNIRDFCNKAVTGGRVMVNKKYKKQVIENKIADYDGVSLYPSSIKRLCDEMGLPKGAPKRIQVYDKKILDSYSYYIVKIQINKINKFQQLPMVSYKNKEGLLKYVNKINEPVVVYVDMLTLTDWVEFQDIEYIILDGVYWNSGYNQKMGEIIQYLFNERLKQKKEGNEAMQQILKLMMNSAYGKTITKKTLTEKIIVKSNYKENYIYNNFNTIKKYENLYNNDSLVTVDKCDNSYNMAHIGAIVLSMSKRIMNEVFDVANRLNCPLYYTDTDSIHCNYDDVPLIEKEYFNKYNKNITGKQLGQFHIDFNLKNSVGEVYATKSIFLGKKCYIDKLEGKDKNGKIINDYHIRLKGVSTQAINYSTNKYFNNNPFKLYEHLIDNEHKFIMNPRGVEYKPVFKYDKHKIYTINDGSIFRNIKF